MKAAAFFPRFIYTLIILKNYEHCVRNYRVLQYGYIAQIRRDWGT